MTNTHYFGIILLVFRDVAQLVARLLWEQDVAGSNPVIPTKIAVLTAVEAAGVTLRLSSHLQGGRYG